MVSFRLWQAQRAAAAKERATAAGAADGEGVAAGAALADEPASADGTQPSTEVEVTVPGASTTASVLTPATDYTLRPPALTIQLADGDGEYSRCTASLSQPNTAIWGRAIGCVCQIASLWPSGSATTIHTVIVQSMRSQSRACITWGTKMHSVIADTRGCNVSFTVQSSAGYNNTQYSIMYNTNNNTYYT